MACPMQEAGKRVPAVPWSWFIATAAFLPIWAVTILPVSLFYQLGKAAVHHLVDPVVGTTSRPLMNLDSGYVVGDSQLIPRAQRKYDIVILGATGFTGRLATRHLAKTYGVGKVVTWAIAGRSLDKLQHVRQSLADELDMPELVAKLEIIVVDTSVPSTLPKLVEHTRVVATTAGPFALFGSPVVEFCAKFGTHYVDITGEVGWVKAMLQMWQETAQKTGAKIISFCGHDSIPWDLSVFKLQEILMKECNDEMATVSFWDFVLAAAPGGTLATILSAIEGTSPVKAVSSDFDLFLRLPDGSKSKYLLNAELPSFIEPSRSPFEKFASSAWTMPFIMAGVNSDVARWSYALRSAGSRSLIYREYAAMADFKSAFTLYAQLLIFGSMLFNPITRSFLKHTVLPKPGEGPSMSDMENNFFLCIKGEGIGVNGNRVESIMFFNRDPACLDTSRMLIESGLCLALEERRLPKKDAGGFWTPSTALGNVLLERLTATGTSFASRIVPSNGSKL
jgi:short subunit dehydrogenase-like uncharacterized protein